MTRIAPLALLVTLLAAGANADAVSAKMSVSAQVIAGARLTVDDGVSGIDIQAADIARGYIDWPAPITIQVRTNSRAGYILEASNRDSSFKTIELQVGSEASLSVGNHETWLARAYRAGGEILTAQARLHLAPNIAPGRYSFPLALAVVAR